MKTKMNFRDIAGMLERDEMREIMGGEYAIPTTIIPPESYDQPMRIPRDELTPSGFVFGTPGKISAPLPGYRTPTYQGGELDTVVVSGRKNSYSNPYGSFQLGGGYNSSYSIGYSNGYGTGGGGGASTGFSVTLDNQQRKPLTDCVFQCLGWISAMRGDTTHDSKYYEQMYAFTNSNQGTNALYNYLTGSGGGVPQNQVLNFTSKFFNATDYSGATSQFLAKYINPSTNPNGNNQLIMVYRNEVSGGLHAVVVTSIIGNQVNFYDPQAGGSSFIDISKKVSFIGVEVSK